MVLRQGPKDNQIGAKVKVVISVVDTEDDVELLLAEGEETHGFQPEAEDKMLEDELDKDLEEKTLHLIHSHATRVGCEAIWLVTAPKARQPLEEVIPPIVEINPDSCIKAPPGNRSKGRRSRFSGLNVVYDAEGQEYPVDDNGIIYIPADEQTGAD